MKNVKYLKIFLLMLCSVILICSCAKKKNRLTNNTLSLSIDPPSLSVSTGTSTEFRIIAKSAASDDVDVVPFWSLSPSALGVISNPNPSKTILFAAKTTGTGKLYAEYEGVRAEALISVVGSTSTTTPVISGINYGLYSETYTAPMIRLDTASDPDSGFMGAWGGASLSAATGAGLVSEGMRSLKSSIGSSIGGWWIEFGYPSRQAKNMSTYAGGYLKFDVKTTKEITVKLEWTGGSKSFKINSDLGIPLDNNWHPVSISLYNFTNIDLTAIEVPAGFHSSGGVGSGVFQSTNFDYYIDNLRWEK